MNNKQIRYRQRFGNFKKSFNTFKKALKIKNPSEIEKGGIIQFYEITFELAWKTLKDYLESEGFNVKSPRETIKLAFKNEIINKGEEWLDALDDRNITTHLYDEKAINQIVCRIRKTYSELLEELYLFLKEKLD